MPLGLNKLGLHGKGEKNDVYPDEKTMPPPGALPSQKDAPPTYAAVDPSTGPEPTATDLNAAFSNLKLEEAGSLDFPDADQCLAHLKLLSAIHNLKEDVGYSDGIFGLWDSRCEQETQKDKALATIREKRWALYVARAVERFEAWWLGVLCKRELSNRLTQNEMVSNNPDYAQFMERGRQQKWTSAMLPPLDVLMVWHAFLLNPRNYLEDCIRFGLKDLWATGLPFAAVNAAIDTDFNYEVPEEAKNHFVTRTGHHWNNAEDAMEKTLWCPRCSQELQIPWTTCGQDDKASDNGYVADHSSSQLSLIML